MGRLVTVIEANLEDQKIARSEKRQARVEVDQRLVKLEESAVARQNDIKQLGETITAQNVRMNEQLDHVAMSIAKLVDAIGVPKSDVYC